LASVWVIGEYGDVLVGSGNFEEEEGVVIEVSDYLVVRLLESILLGPYANQVTREYVMTALMKLSSRLSEGSAQAKIRELLNEHTVSMEVEIQQRAVEYTNLFSYDSIRPAVLERMPVPEPRTIIEHPSSDRANTGQSSSTRAGPSDQDLLLDLMGVGTSGGTGHVEQADAISQSPVMASPSSPAAPKSSNVDLLADLFGGGPSQPVSSPSPSIPAASSNDLMDLLGGETTTTTQQPTSPPVANYGLDALAGLGQALPTSPSMVTSTISSPTQPSAAAGGYEAYTKNGLTIRLLPSKDRTNPAIINIQVLFSNNGSQGVISNLQFQAAVPKSQRLQMNAASSNTVQPNTTEKQVMRINNPQQVRQLSY
jgi:AP-1 complex subunit gamma-1